eukprot:8026881-Pyramimonas_sp.AAC.1
MRTFIDDTIIRAEGTARAVTDTLVQAGACVGQLMQKEAQLVASDKTVVVASSTAMSKEIAR